MSIDLRTIELTPRQKDRLAAIAERTGKDCSAVIDELLDASCTTVLLREREVP